LSRSGITPVAVKDEDPHFAVAFASEEASGRIRFVQAFVAKNSKKNVANPFNLI
jgi:hypothetical protein